VYEHALCLSRHTRYAIRIAATPNIPDDQVYQQGATMKALSSTARHQQHRAPSAAAARIVKVDQRVERANVLRVQALRDQRAESLSKSQTAPSRERRLLAAESDLLSTFRPDG
jgi:hypothetical protein